MAQYTIEDIEILRQKSGITYEEAVNLLEYHNGSLARALIDLEKNGKLKDAKETAKPVGGKKSGNALNFLYRLRIKVSKGDVTIVNLSSIFMLVSVLVAVWLVVIGAVVALILGYRFSIERDSRDFSDDSLENMFKNAGNNVRNTVNSIAHDIGATPKTDGSKSYYEADAAETRTSSPASGTTPVNVQYSDDGNVHVTENDDGSHEADIR